MRKANILGALLLLIVVAFCQENQPQFCWKNSYGRGVGAVLSTCPAGKQKIGLLCYTTCPSGYVRVGFTCIQKSCPSKFRDDGLFCRLAQYGRGAGYPWKFGDPFNDSGMYRRCQQDHGRGNCQKWGLVVYQKCKSGYYAFGCCICRPHSFKCSDYGLGAQGDLSCAKKTIEDPTPMGCPNNTQQQAGLCYKFCQKGHYGVGPVCWANIPKGWVQCGMGAAKSSTVCAKIVFNQIASVGMLAASIATFGTAGQANAATKTAQFSSQFLTQLSKNFDKLKKLYNQSKEFIDLLKNLKKAEKTAKTAENIFNLFASPNPQPADIIRVTAQIVSLFDPTGVAGVIASYSYPLCSTVKK